jgi:DNA polymerase-1
MSDRPKLFVFDASAYVFRAYFALAPLSSKGRPSHAVAGFASQILKILKDYKPFGCIIVFDSKAPSFRKQIYPDYKANRDEAPPDLSDQIVAVMDLCRAAGLPIVQGEGFEADDWIASLVHRLKAQYDLVLLSSDKDLMQLIDDRVKMFDSFREKWIGEKEVEEKWGVPPAQVFELLSLVGDSSDNIPGIEGVGPKTAAKLLKDYKTISGIFENLSQLTPKMKEKIENGRAAVELSQKLIALKSDLPIDADLIRPLPQKFPEGFYRFLVDWDLSRVLRQFQEQVGSSAASSVSESRLEISAPSARQIQKKLIQSAEELESWEKELLTAQELAFDTETNSFNRDEARIVGLSMSDGKTAVYIPWRHQGSKLSEAHVLRFCQSILSQSPLKKIAHNAKYDLQMLQKEGIQVKCLEHDTMISAYLLHADRRSFSLDNLARDFLMQEKGDLDGLLEGKKDFSQIPLDQATEYAAQDASLTWQLYEHFSQALQKQPALNWLFEKIEMPLVEVLCQMETTGVLLDRAHLQKLSHELHQRLDELQKSIFKEAGRELNIASPKQLQSLLFEELKLPATKKTKTGYSTDEGVLEELAALHVVPRLIIEQRKLSKLTSTYVDVLPTMVYAADQRLHTHYHQTGTQTGRLSSSEPNLQNIPIRSPEGMEIRKAFVAAPGFSLMSADYSQVELRLMAHFADDQKMIEAFQAGRDIHAETAKVIFGTSDKEARSRAKAINFGIIYGISAFGLSQQLGIERSEAKRFIDSYFEQFPKIKGYMESAQELARKRKYSETLFGRRRPLPDIESKNPSLRAMAERMAINTPLQGTAADIMKWGMVRVHREILKRGLKSRILLQVHDEMLFEVASGELEALKKLVLEGMSDLRGSPAEILKVPLVVDLSFGQRWSEL